MVTADVVWRQVVGYENLYEVSSCGLVRSLPRVVNQKNAFGTLSTIQYKGKVLTPREDKDGYLTITLSQQGESRTRKVHRLVAQAFINNPLCLEEVNHKDFNKTNNKECNLEWISTVDNLKHSWDNGNHKMKFGTDSPNFKGNVEVWKDGTLIDILTGHKDIEEKGYSSCGVSAVLAGIQKTHRKCTFKRINK